MCVGFNIISMLHLLCGKGRTKSRYLCDLIRKKLYSVHFPFCFLFSRISEKGENGFYIPNWTVPLSFGHGVYVIKFERTWFNLHVNHHLPPKCPHIYDVGVYIIGLCRRTLLSPAREITKEWISRPVPTAVILINRIPSYLYCTINAMAVEMGF